MIHRLSTQLLCNCALIFALSGCTTVDFVELREKPPNPIMDRLKESALGSAPLTERTQRFFQLTSYLGGENTVAMLQHCHNHITTEHHLEALHAAAEISYLAARKAKKDDCGLALELCMDSCRFSWTYLTTPMQNGKLVDPNDLPHRETTEVYNTSLQELLRLVRSSGDYQLGTPIRLPISNRLLNVEIPHPGHGLTKDQLGTFEFVADYELKNLRNRHANAGVGVPIMVKRLKTQHPLEDYYADGLTYPVTVVARFESLENNRVANLELYDARESDGFSVAGTLLPLETDLSTPLAWFLTDPKKSLLDTFAFFRTDKAQELEGLYMVQPYDPDRIPVLMVHGIWSSPITWMEMFNELQSDPKIRDKYQFWFYMYPTGQPLTFAAAGLRERLKELRSRCDPYGRNRRLDEMVLVGHSMGGLMSYLMTIDSEDKLWNAMSKLPVSQIQADEQERSEIQRVYFFESDRSIDRIVTIASPFNGSGYSNVFTRWLSGSLVSLPNATSRLSQSIFRQNNQSIWDRMFAARTSVDSLNKHSAISKLVSQTSVPDDVQHHNIVAVDRGSSISDWTDGVVRFRSSHREDADSEVRVKARHSEVHRHQDAINEVKRVLHEHLVNRKRKTYPVKQVSNSEPETWTSSTNEMRLHP